MHTSIYKNSNSSGKLTIYKKCTDRGGQKYNKTYINHRLWHSECTHKRKYFFNVHYISVKEKEKFHTFIYAGFIK